MTILRHALLVAVLAGSPFLSAKAGVIIGGTRVIFDGSKNRRRLILITPMPPRILFSPGLKVLTAVGRKRHLLLRRRCIVWIKDSKTSSEL